MSARLSADVDDLRQHAGRVDALVARPRSAEAAARSVSAPSDAFGALCGFVGAALTPFQAAGVRACRAAGEALEGAAADVRTCADELVATDVVASAAADAVAERVDAVTTVARWAPGAVVDVASGLLGELATDAVGDWVARLDGRGLLPSAGTPAWAGALR
ncbi:type VII secretion target [Nocardioides sp. CPCC 205120]|uniref:type VII secretion target n=1 Tax=Nocardioides sp. CPCC 205120 TaxID=3406462 RepID=UPI003B50C954